MSERSHYRLLDDLLKYYLNKEEGEAKDKKEGVWSYEVPDTDGLEDERKAKLLDDGYLRRVGNGWSNNDFKIKLEGIMFLEKGGYGQQLKDEFNRRFLQSVQKWAIVLGTVGIFLLSIPWKGFYKFLNNLFCSCYI